MTEKIPRPKGRPRILPIIQRKKVSRACDVCKKRKMKVCTTFFPHKHRRGENNSTNMGNISVMDLRHVVIVRQSHLNVFTLKSMVARLKLKPIWRK